MSDDIVRTGSPEDVVLGVLLDKADLVYPLSLAEHIVAALREADMLPAAAGEGD